MSLELKSHNSLRDLKKSFQAKNIYALFEVLQSEVFIETFLLLIKNLNLYNLNNVCQIFKGKNVWVSAIKIIFMSSKNKNMKVLFNYVG